MNKCIKCGSYAFNLYKEGIDQGGLCDVHYWQGRAHRAEALMSQGHKQEPLDMTKIVQLTYDIDEDKPATMAELFRFARAIEAAHGIHPTGFKE